MSLSNARQRRLPQKMHQPSPPNPETVPKRDSCESALIHSMPESDPKSSDNSASIIHRHNFMSTLGTCLQSANRLISDAENEPRGHSLHRTAYMETLRTKDTNESCILNDGYQLSLHNCVESDDHDTQGCHLNSDGCCNLSENRSKSEFDHGNVDPWKLQRTRTFWRNHVWRIAVLILSILFAPCNSSSGCSIGLETAGRTWPSGDIVLEHGEELRIYCILDEKLLDPNYPNKTLRGKNASDLVFFRNENELDSSFSSIVNETTLMLYVQNPPPAADFYNCKLRFNNGGKQRDEGVCLNKVVIGSKPQEPKNFNCVSHNWENLTCTWEPVHNYITTNFYLVFKMPGRAGRLRHYACPNAKRYEPNPPSCTWSSNTNPIYRQPYEYYTFIMYVSNVKGNLTITYEFHHYAHVIPSKPSNLSANNKTTESALLRWEVPFPMQTFPPGLYHRIAYQNQWENLETWQIINITNAIHAEKPYYNLTGLEYANTAYDVRVYMKSTLATGEDMWSNFSSVTFKTAPKLPGRPPVTDIGSFEITSNKEKRDVYLYWQGIPRYLENGNNFKYHVASVEEKGRKIKLEPQEITKTYAKFEGISFNSFHFEIETMNAEGANEERAKIYVPSERDLPPEPIAFTKIAYDEGLYELSWQAPNTNRNIVNYTIFWCDNDRDRPYQCIGSLNWTHVPKNTTIYNMRVPNPDKVYQFAISANTEKASSGMVWASCTVIHNKVVGKMKSVWVNKIDSHSIDVAWKLDCSDRIGIVEGFIIYYCPIVSPYNSSCNGTKMNTTIKADAQTFHGIVDDLKPYTTYSLSVSVLTKSGEGARSDPLYNTTLEDAATPPRNVKVSNVTNTTMFVTWDEPEAMNGVLRDYQVHYNSETKQGNTSTRMYLTNLVPHKNYSISVSACTVTCSSKSPPVHKVTDIGIPGVINRLSVVANSSEVEIRWSEPEEPGGHLNYYEIYADGHYYKSTKNETRIPIIDCKAAEKDKVYDFQVRAVNIRGNETILEGPWSDSVQHTCYYSGPSTVIWMIIWMIGSLSGIVFLLFLTCLSKRMWLKCKAMQDVEVKLPPGLAPNIKLLQKVGEQHIRQSSADSSGCSSGQESVTSSLTSNSHVSTDSGTEVDPVPTSPNKLLESPPSWESSSLRQRNVGTTKLGLATDTARWDPYVKVAKTGEPPLSDNLSLARSTPNLTDSTGYTTSQQTWSSTGYISMPSSEELSTNPSPVPKESVNVGGYSVVGMAPKPIRTKSAENTDPMNTKLIPLKIESKPAKNPYVSLASLEQRAKGAKQPIDSLHDFDNLTFVEPISKSNLDDLAPFSISDKVSKPYVQSGLMDSMKKPFSCRKLMEPRAPDGSKISFASTSSTDSGNKPFMSVFPSSTTTALQSLKDVSTNPYVPVTSISDVVTKKPNPLTGISDPSQKPYVSVSSVSDAAAKPYVAGTSVFQMLQQQKDKSSSPIPDIDDSDIADAPHLSYPFCWEQIQPEQLETEASVPSTSVTTVPVVKQSSGYVTIAENPTKLEQQAAPPASSPYVQHRQLEKQPPKQNTSQSDEQYSKVTVVPTTMQ